MTTSPQELTNPQNAEFLAKLGSLRESALQSGVRLHDPTRGDADLAELGREDARDIWQTLKNEPDLDKVHMQVKNTRFQAAVETLKACRQAENETPSASEATSQVAVGTGLDLIAHLIQTTATPIDGEAAFMQGVGPQIEYMWDFAKNPELKSVFHLIRHVAEGLQQADRKPVENQKLLERKLEILVALIGLTETATKAALTKQGSAIPEAQQQKVVRHFIFSTFRLLEQHEPVTTLITQKAIKDFYTANKPASITPNPSPFATGIQVSKP